MTVSERARSILLTAAMRRDGVARFDGAGVGVGFQRRAFHAHAEKLVAAGLLVPNAHGDFYITDLGRVALKASHHG